MKNFEHSKCTIISELGERQEKEGKEKLMNNCLTEVNVGDIRASKQGKVVLGL